MVYGIDKNIRILRWRLVYGIEYFVIEYMADCTWHRKHKNQGFYKTGFLVSPLCWALGSDFEILMFTASLGLLVYMHGDFRGYVRRGCTGIS